VAERTKNGNYGHKRPTEFSSKITAAANAHLMDSLLDIWLKNNHITVDTIIFCFRASLSYIQLLRDVQIQPRL